MILTIYLLLNPPIEVLYPDFQFQFYISCLKFIIIESTGILCELQMALLRSQGTLLKYQVEKHEADSLFALYQKKVDKEYNKLMENYSTLWPLYNCNPTKRRHGSESQCTPKRHKSNNWRCFFCFSISWGFFILLLFIVYCDFILVVVFICSY